MPCPYITEIDLQEKLLFSVIEIYTPIRLLLEEKALRAIIPEWDKIQFSRFVYIVLGGVAVWQHPLLFFMKPL